MQWTAEPLLLLNNPLHPSQWSSAQKGSKLQRSRSFDCRGSFDGADIDEDDGPVMGKVWERRPSEK